MSQTTREAGNVMAVIEHKRYVIVYEDESRGKAYPWPRTLDRVRVGILEKRLWPADRLRPVRVEESSC